MSESEEVNRREVAHRLFAAEFEDADYSYAESDEERAPNYVVTPTGARINRLFVVGVLTEVEQVNDDVVRARVVDPTGAFVVYAGQYQPEALAALESADTPSFVAVTGKARTFQPDDSDVVYTSIRPEEVSEVDADTRDRWVVTAAEQTVDRVATMAAAYQRVERGDTLENALEAAGVRESLAAGIPLALDHYETTPAYLDAVRTLAIDAARVVAGEAEEAGSLSLSPSDGGDVPLDFAADLDVPSDAGEVEPMDADPEAGTVDAEFEPEETEAEVGVETETSAETETATETEAEAPAETDAETGSETETETTAEAEAADESTPAPEPAAETPSPDEVAAEAKPDAESEASESAGETAPSEASDEDAAVESEAAGADGEMYELSEEERQEVEENFDVGFSTGDEIPEGGESDLEEQAADSEDASAATAETDSEDDLGDFDAGGDAETSEEAEPADETSEESAAEDEDDEPESTAEEEEEDAGSMDLDLEDYVVDLMSELDDGDGASREDIVATATEERDADEGEVEDAIQDALMSGRCYESGDDRLKAI